MSLKKSLLILASAVLATRAVVAQVNYEGGLVVDGVQLLQDAHDAKKYYYIPQFPRLAQTTA